MRLCTIWTLTLHSFSSLQLLVTSINTFMTLPTLGLEWNCTVIVLLLILTFLLSISLKFFKKNPFTCIKEERRQGSPGENCGIWSLSFISDWAARTWPSLSLLPSPGVEVRSALHLQPSRTRGDSQWASELITFRTCWLLAAGPWAPGLYCSIIISQGFLCVVVG